MRDGWREEGMQELPEKGREREGGRKEGLEEGREEERERGREGRRKGAPVRERKSMHVHERARAHAREIERGREGAGWGKEGGTASNMNSEDWTHYKVMSPTTKHCLKSFDILHGGMQKLEEKRREREGGRREVTVTELLQTQAYILIYRRIEPAEGTGMHRPKNSATIQNSLIKNP